MHKQARASWLVLTAITGSGDIAPRPRVLCNLTAGRPKTQNDYINLNCLAPALKGSIGEDSGQGAFTGLGYRNREASIMNKFQLGGDAQRFINLRFEQVHFETYNVFNHTEWSGINPTPTFNPTTGAVTNLAGPAGVGGGIFGYGALNAVRSPRSVQIGARISF